MESLKRIQLFKNIREDEKIGLRPLCPTWWTMRAFSIQQVLNYERRAEFFETYSEEYSSDAASKCAGYLGTMQHFRTFFFSNLYCHVLSPVDECPHIGDTEVESKLSYLIYILEGKHGHYEQFWQKCLEEKTTHVEEPQLPPRRRIPKRFENPCATELHIFFTPKDYFRQEYVGVCDIVIFSFVAIWIDRLLLHLTMLGDIAKQELLKEGSTVRDLLPEVNTCIKLLRTVPNGARENTNIAQLNTHQAVLDNLDLRPLVNEFIKSNTVRRTFALF
ncbi:hypothetical protein PR048_020837 [Dryococelus australis]|uniref:Uncharacterized protein n=1 Tax=Dryococelus australis TaxID=614101 RepID=A0ABQ9GWJ3_9NEOP|nr:hypothetical protein PR048_020837 [Dryococelus australis]